MVLSLIIYLEKVNRESICQENCRYTQMVDNWKLNINDTLFFIVTVSDRQCAMLSI